MIEIRDGKKGYQTCLYNNKYLHSPYDPLQESIKWLSKLEIKRSDRLIVLEPLLGYSLRALEKMGFSLDKVLVIGIFPEFQTYRRSNNQLNYQEHIYKDENALQTYIRSNIHERESDSIRIILSPSISANFPKVVKPILKVLHAILYRLQLDRNNSRILGPRRQKNILRNGICKKHSAKVFFQASNNDLLLVGPGPSLEKCADEIRQYRGTIAALPSSLDFLQKHSIRPDIVFTMDPGFWASLHYRFLPENCPIIMPLSAYWVNMSNPCIIVNELNGFNGFVSDADHVQRESWVSVLSMALDWLQDNFKGRIILSGIDMDYTDVKLHCSPHSFDGFIENSTDRTNSILNSRYNRRYLQNLVKKNSILNIFKEWLRDFINKYDIDITAFGCSPIESISNQESLPANSSKAKIFIDSKERSSLDWDSFQRHMLSQFGIESQKVSGFSEEILYQWNPVNKDSSDQRLFMEMIKYAKKIR